jgi:DNA polymerase elongation subunit (family B)
LKILLLDIETAPNLAWVWGLWKQNVAINQIAKDNYILCWAAKWLGEDEVYQSSRSHASEKAMLKGIHKLLDEADAVIHFNGKSFDVPWLNGAFLINQMAPPSPFKEIDLKETAAKKFRFPSNKLAYVNKVLGIGEKLKTDFDLWIGCMQNDPQAWKDMETYNVNDVVIMEETYKRLLPWIKGHASHSVLNETGERVCPRCGSTHHQKRGYTYTAASKFQRFQCIDCKGWFKDNVILNRKAYKTSEIV